MPRFRVTETRVYHVEASSEEAAMELIAGSSGYGHEHEGPDFYVELADDDDPPPSISEARCEFCRELGDDCTCLE